MQTRRLGPNQLITSAIGYGAMVLVDGMYGHAAGVVLDDMALARIDELAPAGAAAGSSLL